MNQKGGKVTGLDLRGNPWILVRRKKKRES